MSLPDYYFLAALIPLFWVGICLLTSHVSGWRTLAACYPLSGEFRGRRWYCQSASLRYWTGYNNCVTVGANPEGLYLAVLFLFRPAHAPLFVPWRDVSMKGKKVFFRRVAELRFSRCPSIPVRMNLRLLDRVAGQSEGALGIVTDSAKDES